MKIPYKISKKQHEFIVGHYDDPLCILCTGVGFGKSRAAAVWLALQVASNKQRAIVIAQNYSALSEVFFRELEILFNTWGILYQYKKSAKKIILPNGSEIFGATSEKPSSILGMTEISLLVIDEAAYCKQEIYNFARDRMRGGEIHAKVRLLSSPNGSPASNWFSELVKANPDNVITATSLDNPFTSEEYKRELCSRYEPGSPMYRQQVCGEILDADVANAILQYSDYARYPRESANPTKVWVGADIAAQGRDATVFEIINDVAVIDTITLHKADTQTLVNTALEICRRFDVQGMAVDTTGGFGNGLFDLTRTRIPNMSGVNFGSRSDDPNYTNKRTEIYFMLQKAIKEGFYVGLDDSIIKEELRYTQYTITSAGKTALIPKEDIKRIIGRSPDTSDALALAIYAMNHRSDGETAKRVAAKMLAAHYGLHTAA